jgi:hypothetical protein
MKKTTRLASIIVNNISSQLDSTNCDYILGDESMLMVNGSRSFAIIWIPDQVAIMKRLMVEGRVKERESTPNYVN